MLFFGKVEGKDLLHGPGVGVDLFDCFKKNGDPQSNITLICFIDVLVTANRMTLIFK